MSGLSPAFMPGTPDFLRFRSGLCLAFGGSLHLTVITVSTTRLQCLVCNSKTVALMWHFDQNKNEIKMFQLSIGVFVSPTSAEEQSEKRKWKLTNQHMSYGLVLKVTPSFTYHPNRLMFTNRKFWSFIKKFLDAGHLSESAPSWPGYKVGCSTSIIPPVDIY